MNETTNNSDSEDEVLIYPYPNEHCSRTFPVPEAFRLRVRKRKTSGKKSQHQHHQQLASTSLSSPISILASPGPGTSSLHSSGPLSAPATFSWGAQSPIHPPPRGSPVVPHPPTSPYLLSPGRDQFPAAPTLTSSPLIPAAAHSSVVTGGTSSLLPPPPHHHHHPATSLSSPSPLIPPSPSSSMLPAPAPIYPVPDAAAVGGSHVLPVVTSSSSAGGDTQVGKPGIPVGIAVARQRQKESSSGGSNSQPKDAAPAAPHQPIPWPFPLLAAHHSGGLPLLHPGAQLTPSLPVQDYGRYLNPAAASPSPGAAIPGPSSSFTAATPSAAAAATAPGGSFPAAPQGTSGSSPFWSPFSSYYPFLIPSAFHQSPSPLAASPLPSSPLTALQHYHHQLLLLHAQQSLYPGGEKSYLDPYGSLTTAARPGSRTGSPAASSSHRTGSPAGGQRTGSPALSRPSSALSQTRPGSVLTGSSKEDIKPGGHTSSIQDDSGLGVSGLGVSVDMSRLETTRHTHDSGRHVRSSTPLFSDTSSRIKHSSGGGLSGSLESTRIKHSSGPLDFSSRSTSSAADKTDLSSSSSSVSVGGKTTASTSLSSVSSTGGEKSGSSAEEKKGDRSSDEDNISVGTESLENGYQGPAGTEGSANTSEKSVIGPPSKIRCVDQKFLSGENLPESPLALVVKPTSSAGSRHQEDDVALVVNPVVTKSRHQEEGEDVALVVSSVGVAASHRQEDGQISAKVEPADLELLRPEENGLQNGGAGYKVGLGSPEQPHAKAETDHSEDVKYGEENNGLHLLYEGIQKQLSKTPTKSTPPMHNTPGQMAIKDENKETCLSMEDRETLSRDMYLANQLIEFAADAGKCGKVVVRHTSVDSPLSRHGGLDDGDVYKGEISPCKSTLGLLCDVASSRIEQEGLSVPQQRTIRSRSDETERNIRRTSPTSRQNIREFIERRSSRSSDGHSPGRLGAASPFKPGSSPYRGGDRTSAGVGSTGSVASPNYRSPVKTMADIEEMEAWEISMRLDMADIQKKYREKYRELYLLESRKDKRKSKPIYKRSSSDIKNCNKVAKSPRSSSGRADSIIELHESRNTSIEESDEGECDNNNPQIPDDSPVKSEVTTPTTNNSSSFHETFAKFKKSYLGSRGGSATVATNGITNARVPPNSAAAGDSTRLSATPISGSVLKVKIDRPTPFANLLRLSSTGSSPSPSSGGCPTSNSSTNANIKTEPDFNHQVEVKSEATEEEEEDVMNGNHHLAATVNNKPEIAKVFKRRMSHRQDEEEAGRDGSRSPKKRPKLEKYIVAKSCYDTKVGEEGLKEVENGEEEGEEIRRKEKKKEHKRHKSHHHHHHHHHHHKKNSSKEAYCEHNSEESDVEYKVKKHKKVKTMHHAMEVGTNSGAMISDYAHMGKVVVKEEEGEEMEDTYHHHHHHKKDKKRDKEKKKKRSKDKKRQKVRVRGMQEMDEYVMEIMDRTPTPSSGMFGSGKQRRSTPIPVEVKQEIKSEVDMEDHVKQEPIEYDWATIQERMKSSELTETKLKDGQRILTRIGGHFYPGRVTEISPPDVYGILVDRERGNKPHICSREEVLAKAILEVSPGRVEALQPGARVCAYWSSKYHYLHPGTVVENTQGLNLPRDFVVIELDDGDSRDFHIDSIRYLPPGYPLIVGESDPLNGLGQVRRRRTSSIESPKKPAKSDKKSSSSSDKRTDGGKSSKQWKSEIITNNLKIRIRSPVTEDGGPETSLATSMGGGGPPVLTPETENGRADSVNGHDDICPPLVAADSPNGGQFELPPADAVRDDDQDSAFESNGRDEDLELDEDLDQDPFQVNYRRRMPSADKSKIRAFLPPQHVLWAWSDKGTKPKNKTRKIFHSEICRGDEIVRVGDSAVFLSTSRPDRPYIGKIEDMWESWSGNMKVRVRWFYHAEEAEGTGEGGRRAVDLRLPGALFESSHFDENDIQTISHKCDVIPVQEFAARLASTPGLKESIYENNELYYTAGTYDPVVGTLSFHPNVFKV